MGHQSHCFYEGWTHKAYTAVAKLLGEMAVKIQSFETTKRGGQLASCEEIYARLKLAVIYGLSGECQEWTKEVYEGYL
jgi:hypothetical protein